jgi:predicted ATPase/DNA-binding SARP family transcriptional activator
MRATLRVRRKNRANGCYFRAIGHDALAFRMLGPLDVVAGTEPVALGGTKARALLALLLLHGNQTVSRERVIDELWGERPPRAVEAELRVYVAKLRKALGPEALVTRRHGYALLVDPDRLDAVCFERLAAQGARLLADGDAHAARSVLDEALALWRGPVLADLAYEPFVEGEARRLDERRLAALEERIEADLALGLHADVLAELEQLVLQQPFRERLRAQLMLALYRCGRQSDALEHYRRTAELYAEELGIEPGPELKARERAILNHDPSLRLMALAEPNLPSPPNRLVGRERELEEVAALLSQPETRLVTLTGTGGSGKTRLALEVAAQLQPVLRGPVFFVELGALTQPELVLAAIAGAVGVEETGRAPLRDTLRVFLRHRQLLVVLDNFEHLLDAAPDVATLLADVHGLKVLATSRSPLQIRAEWRYEVRPLRNEDAVALFVERARAIRRGFEPTSSVEALCRRLDRLPLAIELAAARTDLFTPESMLSRLDERFDLLSEGARDLPARQRTLRATIDWSYQLLSDEKRDLFARLAVFAGGCTLAAAEQVCGATPERVASLAAAGLVRRDYERILMLETIREYALERLAASSEEDDVRRRHVECFLRLAQRATLDVEASERLSPADLSVEHDNLREALRWSRDAHSIDVHLRMVAALVVFWDRSGRLSEGDEWLRGALAFAKREAPALRASVLLGASRIAGRRGELERARRFVQQALDLYGELGDERGIARALHEHGTIAARQGEHEHATSLFAESRAIAAKAGDPVQQAGAAIPLGGQAMGRGDYAQARVLFEQALATFRQLGDELMEGQALCLLGVLAVRERHYAAAREPLEQSLRIAREFGYPEAAAYSLSALAALAAGEDELPRAEHLLAAADALFEEVGTTGNAG